MRATIRRLCQASVGVLAAVVTLAACHERQVTTVRSPNPARLVSPDSARYGRITLTFVREVRRPNALGSFPDGGTAYELAAYYEVAQHEAAQHGTESSARVLGRLPLTPVRRGRFGDQLGGRWEWVAPNRFRWRAEHGFLATLVRADSGEFEVPPLDR